MFEFLKKNLGKYDTNNSYVDKNKYLLTHEILDISTHDNVFEINVHRKCTLKEYFDCVEQLCNNIEDLKIPMRILITDGADFFTAQLKKQRIFSLKRLNFKYFIAISEDQIVISQRKFENQYIYETVIHVNKQKNEYTVIKYIHDSNYSTQLYKWYPNHSNRSDHWVLDKNEALLLVQDLLNNLKLIQNIKQILNISYLFQVFDIDSEESYCDDSKKFSK